MVGANITRSMEHEAMIQNEMRNHSQILSDSQIKIDDGQRVLDDLCGCPPEKIDTLCYSSEPAALLSDLKVQETASSSASASMMNSESSSLKFGNLAEVCGGGERHASSSAGICVL